MQPFTASVPAATLERIRARVAAYEWHDAPEGQPWAYGTDMAWLKRLVAWWLDGHDWRHAEARLNAWPHYIAPIEGLDVHFYHVPGRGPAPLPLLLSHGWPGSVFEFLDLIGPLTDPAAHGGDGADAFTVIVPCLPGYGFSGKPRRPIGPRTVARLLHTLVTVVLGHRRYLAQGGDWGSAISAWLGFDYPQHLAGVHLNMVGTRSTASRIETDEERAWDSERRRRFEDGGAYFRQQATRPLTLAYAMMDSPVGTAAWILEKFHAWSDPAPGPLERRFSRELLLDNVMLYLVTRSFGTASWLYRGLFEDGAAVFPDDRRVTVPVAVADFPGDSLYRTPPRRYVEKAYNVQRWTTMPRGGHFAALEAPDLLLDDVRAFARTLR